MGAKTEASLRNCFVFNPTYGSNEGEELNKILFYYPMIDNEEVRMKNVGLVEGIVQFSRVFKATSDVTTLHTQHTRQIYFQAEPNFWIVMSVNVPTVTTMKENISQVEYLEEDLQDSVYEAVLKNAYFMYRLFSNTFEVTINSEGVDGLKTKLEDFYIEYLKNLKLGHVDILNIYSGIQYLPLDKQTFLKVQSLENLLECNYPDVCYTSFLYNDHLIWSGIEPSDMQILYNYLVGTLLPANMQSELLGGSMPRNSLSPFGALHHGRFITGPTNLKNAKTIGKINKIYTFSGGTTCYHFLVYRALSASICLFVKADVELTLELFKDLDMFISPKLSALASDIAEYCSKQVITPMNALENSPRFIYFNKFNLAYKSTVHLDNKQSGNVAINNEQLKIVADLNSVKQEPNETGEIIVKTLQDCWVICKRSNAREFFVVEQQKNAHLIDISKDIKTLSASELKGIFFQPL